VQLGADHVFDYKVPFSDAVQLKSSKKGVNTVFDPVMSGPAFNENLKCLSMDAKWVIYGTMGGPKLTEPAELARLLLKRASILTSTLRSRDD
jgi:tumor protein p53-inducible protein 3